MTRRVNSPSDLEIKHVRTGAINYKWLEFKHVIAGLCYSEWTALQYKNIVYC